MWHSVYIAWRYLNFYKARTLTLVLCITVIVFLPVALERLLVEAERALLGRAKATPLIVGAKGSALDLVMNVLYFGSQRPESIAFNEYERVNASGLATGIPVYTPFKARGVPIVGTTLEYFEFRKLRIASGRSLAVLGDCVIGAAAATRLKLKAGDYLVSTPENAFDLAGVYPLKMQVVGVLARTDTPDDQAVFVDLKTSWIIEGLGHGHEDLARASADVVLARGANTVTANAKLLQYAQITPDNAGSFHFHGDEIDYPITAVIAVPTDERAATLLRGRYLEAVQSRQIIQPATTVSGLLEEIFRIKKMLDGVLGLVALTSIVLILLVLALSLRLRQRELDTLFRLGASRGTTARLIAAEVLIILLVSTVACVVLLSLTSLYAPELIRVFVIR